MKFKLWLMLALLLLCGLAAFSAGCATEADTMQALEIYTNSMAAMGQANSYAFEMEMTQVMRVPESLAAGIVPETMETQVIITGRAMQNPLAMEATVNTQIPLLAGPIEMEMYLADNQMYMFYPMFGRWLRQDLGEYGMEMGQLAELNQATNDPMYFLNLLGDDGAAKASLTTEGQHYILSVTDDDGTLMNKLMDEVLGQLADWVDPSAQSQMEEMLDNMSFSSIEYKIWIDRDSYLATEFYMAFDLTMTVEEETIAMEQVASGRYKDFGSFDTITVPEDVINSAMTMEELDELLQSMMQD